MNRSILRIAALSALTICSGGGFAQTSSFPLIFTQLPTASTGGSTVCDTVVASLTTASSATAEALRNTYPECFPSSSPASTQQITSTTFVQINSISSNISTRLLPYWTGPESKVRKVSANASGLAAGGIADLWNTWGNASQNNVTYADPTVAGGNLMKSSAEIGNLVFGGDYRLASDMLAGASLSLDNSSGSVSLVSNGVPSNTKTNGFSIAPYIGWQLMESVALDASFGYGQGKNELGQGRTKTNRLFYATNLSYAQWLDDWQLSGKIGYFSARERFNDLVNNGVTINNTAGVSRLGQVRIGGEIGYWMPNGVMPYLGAMYTNDVTRTIHGNAPWDKTALTLTVGLNFFSLKDKLTGGIVYSEEIDRSNSRNRTLMGNIGLRF